MSESGGADAQTASAPSLLELGRTVTPVSLLGFGGPSADLARMLDEFVERRRPTSVGYPSPLRMRAGRPRACSRPRLRWSATISRD